MGEPLKPTHIILTPLDADGVPIHNAAHVMPYTRWTELEFLEEEHAFLGGLHGVVLGTDTRTTLEFSAPLSDEQFWAYLELFCGPEVVAEARQDVAALSAWDNEGGYCP